MDAVLVANWTVDYGTGPKPISIPHGWGQDVDIRWEGPAVYRASVDVPFGLDELWFEGVSYAATVSVDGVIVVCHCGIWDGFGLTVTPGRHEIAVSVVKNGGATYPVKSVLSGFLPYVFHTFAGIWGSVWLRSRAVLLLAPASRVAVDGTQLFVDGRPFYMRGILHWGWYPELAHPNGGELISREIKIGKELGFNLFKFCLWLPPHSFLEQMREAGMFAWIELPLWAPATDFDQEAAYAELERIVIQYRHHDNIIAWTAGCELGRNVRPEFRERLVAMIQRETGCPLVKDNSGGSEMYGADLREFGTFNDYHPYADAHWYPPLLDSLDNGPREAKPILLGEFNDHDMHRDTERIKTENLYWASADPALNDQGSRWQYDLPHFLPNVNWNRARHGQLHERSQRKAQFIREFVHDAVRQHRDISGYVVTGWRDTPISTSGMVDDWLESKFAEPSWNDDDAFFIIPHRNPPWVNGGNRPGWQSLYAGFEGWNTWQIGASVREAGATVKVEMGEEEQSFQVTKGRFLPHQIGQISLNLDAGQSHLSAGDRIWPLLIVRPWHGEVIAPQTTITPMPFWRECVQEFHDDPLWDRLVWTEVWQFWLDIAPDGAMETAWLDETYPDWKPVMTRIDTRTYSEHVYIARYGDSYIHCLRLEGRHGSQPYGFANNPVAHAIARGMARQI